MKVHGYERLYWKAINLHWLVLFGFPGAIDLSCDVGLLFGLMFVHFLPKNVQALESYERASVRCGCRYEFYYFFQFSSNSVFFISL